MCISNFCLLRRLRSNDIPETRSHVASTSWFLNIILHQKESGLLREMADSRTGAGKAVN